jgi:hypothetical protein
MLIKLSAFFLKFLHAKYYKLLHIYIIYQIEKEVYTLTSQIKHLELGESDSTKENIFRIEQDERRLKLLNKCMSELTSFAASVQPGLMLNNK